MAWRPLAEISDQDIENLIERAIPDNTKKATKYGMNIFNGRVRYVYICIWHTILFNRKMFFPNESWNLSLEWNIDEKLNSLLSFCTNIEWLGTSHEYTVPVQEIKKTATVRMPKNVCVSVRKMAVSSRFLLSKLSERRSKDSLKAPQTASLGPLFLTTSSKKQTRCLGCFCEVH